MCTVCDEMYIQWISIDCNLLHTNIRMDSYDALNNTLDAHSMVVIFTFKPLFFKCIYLTIIYPSNLLYFDCNMNIIDSYRKFVNYENKVKRFVIF